ncbi:MAG: helix-turn-helix transcriptional regulator, partial [Burkholderiaceae bacterium]|nr:helix-turn-helix transcriptional regulator [Burkholderiaceae bacterium]
ATELRAPAGAMHEDLQAAGLSYKELVEDVRRDLALSYLRQRHLPFSEIAMLLGYSELSAFSRAFRRWTGASPRTYRIRMLNG